MHLKRYCKKVVSIVFLSTIFFNGLVCLAPVAIKLLIDETDKASKAYSEVLSERTKTSISMEAIKSVALAVPDFSSAENQAVIKELFTRFKKLVDQGLNDSNMTLAILKLLKTQINDFNSNMSQKIKNAVAKSQSKDSPIIIEFIEKTFPKCEKDVAQKINQSEAFFSKLEALRKIGLTNITEKIAGYCSLAKEIAPNVLNKFIQEFVADFNGLFENIKTKQSKDQKDLITKANGFNDLLNLVLISKLVTDEFKNAVKTLQSNATALLAKSADANVSQPERGRQAQVGAASSSEKKAEESSSSSRRRGGASGPAPVVQSPTVSKREEYKSQVTPQAVSIVGTVSDVKPVDSKDNKNTASTSVDVTTAATTQTTTVATNQNESIPSKLDVALAKTSLSERIIAVKDVLRQTSAGLSSDEKAIFKEAFSTFAKTSSEMNIDEINKLISLFRDGFDNQFVFAKNQKKWIEDQLDIFSKKLKALQAKSASGDNMSVKREDSTARPVEYNKTTEDSSGKKIDLDELKTKLKEENDSTKLWGICADALSLLEKSDIPEKEKSENKPKSLINLVANKIRDLYSNRKNFSEEQLRNLSDLIIKISSISKDKNLVKDNWLDSLNVLINVVKANSLKDYVKKMEVLSEAIKFVANSTDSYEKISLVDAITNLGTDREKMTLDELKTFDLVLRDLKSKASVLSGLANLDSLIQNIQTRVLNMETKVMQQQQSAAQLLK